MREDMTDGATQVVVPVGDLRGRTVWSEGGERIGTVSSVESDDDGRVIAFNVRERWMLGAHHNVMASGMRLDEGDVVLPESSVLEMRTREGRSGSGSGHRRSRSVEPRDMSGPTSAPSLVAGRDGARERFGGFDFLGSLFGGLVTIASIVLVGGVLAAIFGTGAVDVDTSLDSLDAVTSSALIVGAVTIFLAALLGGWAAGRSSRFDGVGNGIAAAMWALAFGVAFGLLGSWLGDEYNVYANSGLPRFTTDEFALWGSVALAAALVLLLLGGALGGMIGERWHRKVDQSLLENVAIGGSGGGHDGGIRVHRMTSGDATSTDEDSWTDEDREARRIRNLNE